MIKMSKLARDVSIPGEARLRLREALLRPYLFLLESVEGGEVWPLYSFPGADPLMVLTAKSGRLTLRSLSRE